MTGRPALPTIIPPGVLTTPTDPDLHLVPALIATAGAAAGWRYVKEAGAYIGICNCGWPHLGPAR